MLTIHLVRGSQPTRTACNDPLGERHVVSRDVDAITCPDCARAWLSALPHVSSAHGDTPPFFHGDPVLRSQRADNRLVYALGGLHYIHGNAAPYFSLTIESWRIEHGQQIEDSFGAAHEELLTIWPELAPLAALHLSDWHGVPMHAADNGFYHLAGYAGGLGERCHAGNETHGRHGDETPDDVRERCLRQWAAHVRLPIDEARDEADNLITQLPPRAAHAAWIDAQRYRWAFDALRCVRALDIRFYYGARLPQS